MLLSFHHIYSFLFCFYTAACSLPLLVGKLFGKSENQKLLMEIIKITMSQQKTEERCVIVVDAGLDKFIVLFDWKLAY